MQLRAVKNRVATLTCMAIVSITACTNERSATADSAAQRVRGAHVDTLTLPARHNIPVLLHLPDEIPRELLELAARDTIDPVGASTLGEQAIQFGDHVAIADGNRVVLVDSAHRRIWKVGRRGQGPNEFDGNVAICRTADDTLVAMDGIPRLTIIDATGRIARQLSFPPAIYTSKRTCLEDGTLVTSRLVPGDSLALERYDLTGARIGAITTVHFDFKAGGTEVIPAYALVYNAGSLYWGDSWEPQLREFGMDGTLRRVIQLTDNPEKRPTGPDVKPAFAPKMGSKAPFFRTTAKFEHYPYYLSAHVTSNGDIWLRDFPRFFPATERWTGFSRDGKVLGAVTVDSAAGVERRIMIEAFDANGVLVRYETPDGPVYYKRVLFPKDGGISKDQAP